jgi:hypothetical protein
VHYRAEAIRTGGKVISCAGAVEDTTGRKWSAEERRTQIPRRNVR